MNYLLYSTLMIGGVTAFYMMHRLFFYSKEYSIREKAHLSLILALLAYLHSTLLLFHEQIDVVPIDYKFILVTLFSFGLFGILLWKTYRNNVMNNSLLYIIGLNILLFLSNVILIKNQLDMVQWYYFPLALLLSFILSISTSHIFPWWDNFMEKLWMTDSPELQKQQAEKDKLYPTDKAFIKNPSWTDSRKTDYLLSLHKTPDPLTSPPSHDRIDLPERKEVLDNESDTDPH